MQPRLADARILVTGGAGFIGSAVIRHLIAETGARVINLDALTYAAIPGSLGAVEQSDRYAFEHADIRDAGAVRAAFERHRPTSVMHLAAESHVDRSIDDPGVFIDVNVAGTAALLQEALRHWRGLDGNARAGFRFLHVSTDEVFGSAGPDGVFDEASPYRPNSPYAASKAASDHLVRAWARTYGLPTLASHGSNTYGPYHYPEKLIPLTILRALEGAELPVYGRGDNVREWLHVEDHARALAVILERGAPGETYAIGASCERTNLGIVETVCDLIDRMAPSSDGPRRRLIRFVADRPGHDHRYAVDAAKLRGTLGWAPRETFESGLEKTVRWYLDNRAWWEKAAGEALARRGLRQG